MGRDGGICSVSVTGTSSDLGLAHASGLLGVLTCPVEDSDL